MKVTQSCLPLCDPMGCSLPGSSVHGILEAGILKWIAVLYSRESSQPRDQIEPRSPTLQGASLPSEPPGKPEITKVGSLSLLQGIFLTQESNCGLLHCRWILYQLSYQESCSGNLLEVKCVLKYFEGMDNGDFSLVRNIIPSFLSLPMRLGY